MPIKGIEQPEYIEIDKEIRLRKFDGKYDFAFEWYQDIDTVCGCSMKIKNHTHGNCWIKCIHGGIRLVKYIL